MISEQDLSTAHERIAPFVHRTPILVCRSISEQVGAALLFKCENFQKIGAFKIRGAVNAVQQLTDDERARGVATHSSGNHAQALALAARQVGTHATIVMPRNSAAIKKEAVRGYGATIIDCEATFTDREATLQRVVDETGAVFVPPFNDWRVIAGQGTAAKELIEDEPGLDIILAPVGGGGLLSGTALAAHFLSPGTHVVGVEPEEADDAYRSLQSGEIQPLEKTDTIADGLRTSLGDKTFAVIREHVDEIITVSEPAIVDAMRLVWERMKIVIEPSAAVAVAGAIKAADRLKGQRVGVILSGGNVDLDQLPFGA